MFTLKRLAKANNAGMRQFFMVGFYSSLKMRTGLMIFSSKPSTVKVILQKAF